MAYFSPTRLPVDRRPQPEESPVSDREREIRRKLKNDFEHYAKKCLRIKAKKGQIESLELNDAQRHAHEQLELQLSRTGKIRALILKGRQQGISTYTEGRFYWRVTHRKGVRAFILTHEDAATQNLFDMTDRYHKMCPDLVRPHTGAANAKELYFDRLDSGYKVGTAGTKAVGRSSTIQYFHGSEVAMWPHAESHFAGVMQAVPDEPGTEVILESTANGAGGKFYELWQDAAAGIGDYIAIFVPWYWQSEYRRNATGIELTPEEEDLKAAYGLDNEQLAWRRAKIHELGEALCSQEYPNTAEEAFILSGRCAFDPVHLTKIKAGILNPLSRHVVQYGVLREHSEGELRIWEHPVAGNRYAIGADVAEGLAHGDFSCTDVVEVPSGKQVGQWHGHVAPDTFGEILVALAKHYNHAKLGVERNNHGLTTLTKIIDLEYDNLYVQTDAIRDGANAKTAKIGWTTSAKSKDHLINNFIADVRDGTHGICCGDTLREMRTFIINDKGGYEAAENCHDDRVMSRAIAGEVCRKFAQELTHDTSHPRTPRKVAYPYG